MAITTQIERIYNAKIAIKNAIIVKGVDVDDSLSLDDYASKILLIQQGEGESNHELYKQLIINAIKDKNINIPDDVDWEDIPNYISQITGGGGTDTPDNPGGDDSDTTWAAKNPWSSKVGYDEIWYKTQNGLPLDSIVNYTIAYKPDDTKILAVSQTTNSDGWIVIKCDTNIYRFGSILLYISKNSDNKITEIVFNDFVKVLDTNALSMSSLTKVYLGKSIFKISSGCFNNSGLTNLILPSTVTTIMGYLLYSTQIDTVFCYAKTAPQLEKPLTPSVKNGVLVVPSGSDYSSWIGNGEYDTLSANNWTIQYMD